jgi:hypothetical protein
MEATCDECGRLFDLTVANDADEWAYGHDCEAEAHGTGCCGDYHYADCPITAPASEPDLDDFYEDDP